MGKSVEKHDCLLFNPTAPKKKKKSVMPFGNKQVENWKGRKSQIQCVFQSVLFCLFLSCLLRKDSEFRCLCSPNPVLLL